jgi:hypothetical protein
MPNPLTPQEIADVHIGSVHGLSYIHYPKNWGNIDLQNFPAPFVLQFNASIRDNMPNQIKNGKGIYMFFLEPNHPFSPELRHLLYVGRVRAGGTNYNFFQRFYQYVNSIGNKAESSNKMKLTNLWPDHTYVYFYCLDNETDARIVEIESMLYNSLVPPLNDRLEGDAKQTRDFYRQ